MPQTAAAQVRDEVQAVRSVGTAAVKQGGSKAGGVAEEALLPPALDGRSARLRSGGLRPAPRLLRCRLVRRIPLPHPSRLQRTRRAQHLRRPLHPRLQPLLQEVLGALRRRRPLFSTQHPHHHGARLQLHDPPPACALVPKLQRSRRGRCGCLPAELLRDEARLRCGGRGAAGKAGRWPTVEPFVHP